MGEPAKAGLPEHFEHWTLCPDCGREIKLQLTAILGDRPAAKAAPDTERRGGHDLFKEKIARITPQADSPVAFDDVGRPIDTAAIWTAQDQGMQAVLKVLGAQRVLDIDERSNVIRLHGDTLNYDLFWVSVLKELGR
jgi:hypothetical protein